MKKIQIKTETYELKDGFYIDVQEDLTELNKTGSSDVIGFWLYHKNYGIKNFLFGGKKKDFNYASYESMCDFILEIDKYIDAYKEDYMD